MCKGGLRIHQLKQCLTECDAAIFANQQVLIFMGMNDLQTVINFCSFLSNYYGSPFFLPMITSLFSCYVD